MSGPTDEVTTIDALLGSEGFDADEVRRCGYQVAFQAVLARAQRAEEQLVAARNEVADLRGQTEVAAGALIRAEKAEAACAALRAALEAIARAPVFPPPKSERGGMATAQEIAEAALAEPDPGTTVLEAGRAMYHALTLARAALLAPTHEANDLNCTDWRCRGCDGDEMREEALNPVDGALAAARAVGWGEEAGGG